MSSPSADSASLFSFVMVTMTSGSYSLIFYSRSSSFSLSRRSIRLSLLGLFMPVLDREFSTFFFFTFSFRWPCASLTLKLLFTELPASLSCSLMLMVERLLDSAGDCSLSLTLCAGGIEGPVAYREFKDEFALPVMFLRSSPASVSAVPPLSFLDLTRNFFFSLQSLLSRLSFFRVCSGSITLTKLREFALLRASSTRAE